MKTGQVVGVQVRGVPDLRDVVLGEEVGDRVDCVAGGPVLEEVGEGGVTPKPGHHLVPQHLAVVALPHCLFLLVVSL